MSGVVNTADVWTDAVKVATDNGQLIEGDPERAYITLQQLENILNERQHASEEGHGTLDAGSK